MAPSYAPPAARRKVDPKTFELEARVAALEAKLNAPTLDHVEPLAARLDDIVLNLRHLRKRMQDLEKRVPNEL